MCHGDCETKRLAREFRHKTSFLLQFAQLAERMRNPIDLVMEFELQGHPVLRAERGTQVLKGTYHCQPCYSHKAIREVFYHHDSHSMFSPMGDLQEAIDTKKMTLKKAIESGMKEPFAEAREPDADVDLKVGAVFAKYQWSHFKQFAKEDCFYSLPARSMEWLEPLSEVVNASQPLVAKQHVFGGASKLKSITEDTCMDQDVIKHSREQEQMFAFRLLHLNSKSPKA